MKDTIITPRKNINQLLEYLSSIIDFEVVKTDIPSTYLNIINSISISLQNNTLTIDDFIILELLHDSQLNNKYYEIFKNENTHLPIHQINKLFIFVVIEKHTLYLETNLELLSLTIKKIIGIDKSDIETANDKYLEYLFVVEMFNKHSENV